MNNNSDVEKIYDTYGSMMYGTVINLSRNKEIAEEIFIKSFIQLKKELPLHNSNVSLWLDLFRFINTFTLQQLKTLAYKPSKITPPKGTEIIYCLCTEYLTLKEVGQKFGMTEQQIKKKLYEQAQTMLSEKTHLAKSPIPFDTIKNTAGLSKNDMPK